MKVAIVNQPRDTILPPKQTSVGSCTYGMARSLARTAQVRVYGLQDIHGLEPAFSEHHVDFRFVPSTRFDRFLFMFQVKLARFVRRSSPISTSRWMFPGYGRRVALDLKKEQCDVIHLQHCSQYIPVIRSFNPKAKIVLHLHAEWFSQTSPAILEGRLGQIDLLTTVSDYVTEKTKRTFPSIDTKGETTYNGIDADEFSREPKYVARSQRRVKRILYAGAVSPHKGIHILLEAFARVVRQYPDVILDVLGPIGSYPIEENFDLADTETIEQMTPFYPSRYSFLSKFMRGREGSGQQTYLKYLKASVPPEVVTKVSFLGMVERSELIDRYYEANIFAFPPIWNEGFGLPPLEAMAAGVAVVATQSGAVVETVVHGQTGLLVEKNDAEELAQALLVLLKDEGRCEAMGRAGRSRALDNFTWDKVAEEVHTRYEVLCEPALFEVHR